MTGINDLINVSKKYIKDKAKLAGLLPCFQVSKEPKCF